jgi:hypothetical protein
LGDKIGGEAMTDYRKLALECLKEAGITISYPHKFVSATEGSLTKLVRLAVERDRQELAKAIHYPDCWDTACYDTLESALAELAAGFFCTNDDCGLGAFSIEQERGEPVAIYKGREGEYGYETITLYEDIPVGADIYLAPPAEPEGWQCVPKELPEAVQQALWRIGFNSPTIVGVWNTALGMLAAAPKKGEQS